MSNDPRNPALPNGDGRTLNHGDMNGDGGVPSPRSAQSLMVVLATNAMSALPQMGLDAVCLSKDDEQGNPQAVFIVCTNPAKARALKAFYDCSDVVDADPTQMLVPDAG